MQNLICEYFAAVINLCKDIILFSRKPFITQLPALILPFDSQFKSHKDALFRIARAIAEEVSLASSRTQRQEAILNSLERKENSRFRTLAMRNREHALAEIGSISARQKRLDLLNKLCSYDHSTAWRQARNKGNVKWILDDAVYRKWKKTISASAPIVLEGKIGSGKTVLMASVIADIMLDKNAACVAYFFCRFDDTESLRAETVIGSISRQLISNEDLHMLSSIDDHPSIHKMLEVTLQALTYLRNRESIVCIDGLDDCEDRDREQILDFLNQLSTKSAGCLKVIYSIRPDNQRSTGRFLQEAELISISTLGHRVEMDRYIRQNLEEYLENGDLTLGDSNLILRVQEALRKRADGMYLWLHFQLQALREQSTDTELIQALENLPHDMHTTYMRIFKKIRGNISLGSRLFRVIAVAERPLSMEELREVLAIEPGDPSLRSNMLINDISKAIAQSGGSFLVVDEQDFTVRFAHESVRQFFTGGITEDDQAAKHRVDTTAASLDLGLRCVTYLNLGIFDTQIAKRPDTAAWKAVTPFSIAQASTASNRLVAKMALSLLRGPKHASIDVSQQFEKYSATKKSFPELTYVFLDYAKSFVFWHTKSLVACDTVTDCLFYKILDGYLPFVPRPWPGHPHKSFGRGACLWAIDNEHLGIMHRYIRSQSLVPREASTSLAEKRFCILDDTIQTMFRAAFKSKKTKVLEFLLQKLVIGLDIQLSLMWPAIAFDTILLQMNLAEMAPSSLSLIRHTGNMEEYGLDVKPRRMRIIERCELQILEMDQEWNVLALAAACNSLTAVKFFLDAGILKDIPTDDAAELILSSLREAACRGFTTVFKLLLDSFHVGRQPDFFWDQYGWAASGYAATLSSFDKTSLFGNKGGSVTAERQAYDIDHLANLARTNRGKVWASDETFTPVDGSPVELSAEGEIQALPRWMQLLEIQASKRISCKVNDSVSSIDHMHSVAGSMAEGTFSSTDALSVGAISDLQPAASEYELTGPANTSSTPEEMAPVVTEPGLSPPSRPSPSLPASYERHSRSEFKNHSTSTAGSTLDSRTSEVFTGSTPMTPSSSKGVSARRRKASTSFTKTSEPEQPRSSLDFRSEQNHPRILHMSKPRPTPFRARAAVPRVQRRVDPHAQTLRAQAATIKAQVALVEACRPKQERKVWWENTLLVFVVLIFWPTMLLLSVVYMAVNR